MANKNKATTEQREDIYRAKLAVQEAADKVFRLKQQEIEKGWNYTGSGYTKGTLDAERDQYLSESARAGDGDIYHKKMPIEKSYRNSAAVNEAVAELQAKREGLQNTADDVYGTTSKKEGFGVGSLGIGLLVLSFVIASVLTGGLLPAAVAGVAGVVGGGCAIAGAFYGVKGLLRSRSESGTFSKGQPNYDLAREGKSKQDTNITDRMKQDQKSYDERKESADKAALRGSRDNNKGKANILIEKNTGFFKEVFNERGGVLEAFAKKEELTDELQQFNKDLNELEDTLASDSRYLGACDALDSGNLQAVRNSLNPHIQQFLANQKDNQLMKKWSQEGAAFKKDMETKASADQSVPKNAAAKGLVDAAAHKKNTLNASAAITARQQERRQAAGTHHSHSRQHQQASAGSRASVHSSARRTGSTAQQKPLEDMQLNELREELGRYRTAQTNVASSTNGTPQQQGEEHRDGHTHN